MSLPRIVHLHYFLRGSPMISQFFWIFLDFFRHVLNSSDFPKIAPEVSWNLSPVIPSVNLQTPGLVYRLTVTTLILDNRLPNPRGIQEACISSLHVSWGSLEFGLFGLPSAGLGFKLQFWSKSAKPFFHPPWTRNMQSIVFSCQKTE